MQDSIYVVEAVKSDLPAIRSLLRELIDATSNKQALDTRAAADNLPALLRNSDSYLLVAKDGGTIVGFINVVVRQTALHVGSSGLIDELVVEKGLRGRGVGRSLVLAAVEKCRQVGCCELEVSTEKTNIAARKFYKQCGFQEDAVLLEMPL